MRHSEKSYLVPGATPSHDYSPFKVSSVADFFARAIIELLQPRGVSDIKAQA
jgi:hypothetical protein